MQRAARNHPGADWTPPVEAWEGELPAVMDASIVYLGCEGDAGPDFRRQVRDALGAADARTHVEYARFETAEGRPTTVAITYWLNRSAYEAWRASDAALRTLDPSAYAGGPGIWTESYAVKRQNIETLFSSDDQSPGFAALAADGVGDPTPLHGYYGSMRDRIWASNDSDHKSDVETVARTALQRPAGEVRITAPKSLCAIRSGQDWSLCEGDQKR
ncbi:MAG: phenylacetaldoxime dehydratase family protein, partial [Pseudomonadota bacterium]